MLTLSRACLDYHHAPCPIQCVLCGVVLGAKMDSADTRWHCKHCGRSCCLKCAPNSSKRSMPKCVQRLVLARGCGWRSDGTLDSDSGCYTAPRDSHSQQMAMCSPLSRACPCCRYGFQQPVRCCLECTELLDAQNVAVDAMEAALECRDLDASLRLFDSQLLSLDYESASGLTPLILAVLQERADDVARLLDMGASLNLASAVRNQTPLMAAVAEVPRNADLLRLLVDRGASPAMVAADGNSALSLVRAVCAARWAWRRCGGGGGGAARAVLALSLRAGHLPATPTQPPPVMCLCRLPA